jgi:long-chain acyl-CoA synthetase
LIEHSDPRSTPEPWLRLYPSGVGPKLVPAHETALDAFRSAVARGPDEVFLDYFDTASTFADVDAETDALAAALRDGGFGGGQRAALYMQNVPQYVLALIAVWKTGGIAVSVNPMLKARELRQILDDSGATVLVALETLHAQHGRDAVEGSSVRRVITTSELDYQSMPDPRLFADVERSRTAGTDDLVELVAAHRGRHVPDPGLGPDDIAILTYTSGTTGAPKGATNTHRDVVVGGQFYRDWFGLTADDRLLGIAPLFHVTGLSGHIAAALLSPMRLILAYRFDLEVLVELIRDKRPTFTVGAITVFIALANAPGVTREDLASLRTIASGGAPIAPAVVDAFARQFGHYIHNVYGMTETTAPTHGVPPGATAPVDPRSGALSVGVPAPGIEMSVVNDDGAPAGPGEIGELVVSGSRVVPGYWRKPEETAAAFSAGRLLTGDVGFLDEEGWFYIVDRKKDVIIASGYKVWPRDVEDVLYAHPAVREVAVVGVPDAYRGESVKAFVSLKAGAAVQPEELVAFAKERLAAYKYPREIQVLDEIPKTVTGKLLRRELRAESAAV